MYTRINLASDTQQDKCLLGLLHASGSGTNESYMQVQLQGCQFVMTQILSYYVAPAINDYRKVNILFSEQEACRGR